MKAAETKEVIINDIKIGGNNKLVIIAGPCVIENEEITLQIAESLKETSEELSVPIIFKASYDKANRSSYRSFRGVGISKGLKILEKVKDKFNFSILSDVHTEEEAEAASPLLDILQIPAFLCRQTDFIISVASKGKSINIKKGQFLAPWDIKNIVEKVEFAGNQKLLITERGTSFGYNNLVSDMRSLVILRGFGYPVIFDATHSVQLPGGLGESSGGQREFVEHLGRAAVAVGVDAVFIEVHPDPSKALCDGPNSLALKDVKKFISQLTKIDNVVKG